MVIVFVAAAAFGRIMSVASGIREIETVPPAETVPVAETVPAKTGRTMTLPFRRTRTEDQETETVG